MSAIKEDESCAGYLKGLEWLRKRVKKERRNVVESKKVNKINRSRF